jgi:hypothetical protein
MIRRIIRRGARVGAINVTLQVSAMKKWQHLGAPSEVVIHLEFHRYEVGEVEGSRGTPRVLRRRRWRWRRRRVRRCVDAQVRGTGSSSRWRGGRPPPRSTVGRQRIPAVGKGAVGSRRDWCSGAIGGRSGRPAPWSAIGGRQRSRWPPSMCAVLSIIQRWRSAIWLGR